jgi:hypothetical protein
VLGSGGGGSEKLLKFISSLTMGIAIPIMHYTGMAAVTYTPMDTSPDLSYAIDISALANTAVILITLIMLAAVFLIHPVACVGRSNAGAANTSKNLTAGFTGQRDAFDKNAYAALAGLSTSFIVLREAEASMTRDQPLKINETPKAEPRSHGP